MRRTLFCLLLLACCGSLFALDLSTGAVDWQTSGFGSFWINTPAYDGAALYFGTDDSQYYGVDAENGNILWSTRLKGPVESSPAYANGLLYTTSLDGNLRILDAFDGSILETDLLNPVGSTSSPALSDGWVWVEDYFGNIYGYQGTLLPGAVS